ncbi:hypothetical protein VMT65_26275 [Nocardia sp. CDC153]|uniref:DUF6630 family protein n=1 Tax=Nocardia sp. CDC153 TaxID=3112167 RepID=UPI002DB92DB3|nr:hypothetical protein [Nocardia sp. CDC153]MEC3956568.1 hypothetical protein [Nocardia sp. CDC153]
MGVDHSDVLATVQAVGETEMNGLLSQLENAKLVAAFEWDDEPKTIREQLEALLSFPAAMPWDWYDDFLDRTEDYDVAEAVEHFLGLVGKHSLKVGTATVSVDTGDDGYAIGFAPKNSRQLKNARRWVTVVRRGTFTRRFGLRRYASLFR